MTKETSVLRGLAVFGAAWQLLWLLTQAGVRASVREDPVGWPSLFLLVSFVAWAAIWPSLFGPLRDLRRLRWVHITIIAAVFAAGVALIIWPESSGSNTSLSGALVITLAAGLAGLYLDRRVGVLTVVVMVAFESVLVVANHVQGGESFPLSVDLVYPAYGLAIGFAAVASRHALVISARAQDASTQELARQQQARAASESIDEQMSAAEARVHESVLNTLTAIVRGGLDTDDQTRLRMRERAAEAGDVLKQLTEGSDMSGEWVGDLRTDLAKATNDLRRSGLQVTWTGVLAPESATGDAAYRAMGRAVREALQNIHRHASARNVRIHGTIVRANGGAHWRIEVSDDGVGFDPMARGFGLQAVVVDGLSAVDGWVRIESDLGQGTSIDLHAPVMEFAALESADPAVVGPLRAIGAPVLVAFTAFTVLVAGATWQFVTNPTANALALAVFAATATVLGWAIFFDPHPFLRWWVAAVVLIGVPIMTRVEKAAEATASPVGDWSSEAGAALLFIVVAAGAWWMAPLALLSWLTAQDQFIEELTQPGTIVIVIAAILGWTLRRANDQTRRTRVDVEDERAALGASQERLLEFRRRYADVDAASLIHLLRSLAEGTMDPRDEWVREECARQERMFRSVLMLHPESNFLHRDLVKLAVIARDEGIDLTVKVDEDAQSSGALRGMTTAQRLLRAARPGSSARASVTRVADRDLFRLVVMLTSEARGRIPAGVELLDEEQGLVAYEESCGLGPDAARSGYDGTDRTPAGI